MKKWSVSIILLAGCQWANAQKPALDTSAFKHWGGVQDACISNDGKYSSFFTTIGQEKKLVIIQNDGDWRTSINNVGATSCCFSKDSRLAYFITASDSLGTYDLKKHVTRFLFPMRQFAHVENAEGDWLIGGRGTEELMVFNGVSRQLKIFHQIADYKINKEATTLLVRRDSAHEQGLTLVDIATGAEAFVWRGRQCRRYTFDPSGKGVAFITTDSLDRHSIAYYQQGDPQARELIGDQSSDIAIRYELMEDNLIFSQKGDRILFTLKNMPSEDTVPANTYRGVNIWNYKDEYLQSEQLGAYRMQISAQYATFSAVLSVHEMKLIYITQSRERVINNDHFQDYLLIGTRSLPKALYGKQYRSCYYLVSLGDGSKTLLGDHSEWGNIEISPHDRFVVWFDRDSTSYFSYDLGTHKKRNLSMLVGAPLYDSSVAHIFGRTANYGPAAWVEANDFILLYDQYDIWMVDPGGKIASLNVTKDYGRKNKIIIGLIRPTNSLLILNSLDNLLLAVFDPYTKENGFCIRDEKSNLNWSSSNMENCLYYISRIGTGHNDYLAQGVEPIKARYNTAFLVYRTSADKSPNLYFTTDFHSYRQLSHVYPENAFNWIKSELVNFKQLDGTPSQGILYKPENFDSTKKYPVIFYYYEQRTNGLNEFIYPGYSYGALNIPYYVSNGYLIFVPDIFYKAGHTGVGVLNAVVAAAYYLFHFSWVDSTRLGLEGQSFGGWETNFLVTHTHLFAAACAEASFSDEISFYNYAGLLQGLEPHSYFEQGVQAMPYGLNVTPWKSPDLYMENSPVFFADRVSTPLLLAHGEKDDAVPFSQATEMFTALQRAGKKVWLLDYENGHHGLGKEDGKDYSIRVQQFFDHYLKGAPPPKWMTKGIPAERKGLDLGYDLDTSGAQP